MIRHSYNKLFVITLIILFVSPYVEQTSCSRLREFCSESKRLVKPRLGDCGCWVSGEVLFTALSKTS